MRSFLRQLATPRAPLGDEEKLLGIHKEILHLEKNLTLQGSRLDVFRCRDLMAELIDSYATATFVLDALDECDPSSRQDLLEALDYLVLEKHPKVRILISSRRDEDITRHFESRPQIEVVATSSQEDIAAFVETKLQSARVFSQKPPELKAHIRKTLLDQNEGMFLWVALQLDQLSRCVTAKHMEERLGALPKGLNDTYRDIFQLIEDDPYRKMQVLRVIPWIMVAETSLTTGIIATMMSLDSMTDSSDEIDEELNSETIISDLFYNLLVYEPTRQNWRFCHLSAREYFENHHFSLEQAHASVAATCLKYLLYPPQFSREYRYRSNSRARLSGTFYPRHYWPTHLRWVKEPQTDIEKRVVGLLKEFLGDLKRGSKHFRRWADYLEGDQRMSFVPDLGLYQPRNEILRESPMIAACCLIPWHLLADWWESPDLDLNHCSRKGRSLLELSLSFRNKTMWQNLLRKKVLVDIGSLNPLRVAIQEGLNEAIDGILGARANVNEVGTDDPRGSLSEACIHDGIVTMRKLLKQGAWVNQQIMRTNWDGSYASSPLLEACQEAEKLQTFRLLIKKGAEVNGFVPDGCCFVSPLHAAIRSSNWTAANFLLDHGANASVTISGRTFLDMIALPSGYLVFRRLVDMGLKPTNLYRCLIRVCKGECCEVLTVCTHKLEAFQMVLELGADVNDTLNRQRDSPLVVAARRGDTAMMELLLSRSADIDLVTNSYSTESALCAAAYEQDIATLKFLIAAGAKANAGTRCVTPLIRVFTAAHGLFISRRKSEEQATLDCAKLLIQAGAKINTVCPDGYHSTALAAASGTDSTRFIDYLLEEGADINLSNRRESPLSAAIKARRDNIIKLLLDKGADPNLLLAEEYGSALATAAERGNLEACELLLAADAQPNLRLFGRYRYAIEAALNGVRANDERAWPYSFCKHREVLDLLLKSGAEPPMPMLRSLEAPLDSSIYLSGRRYQILSAVASHQTPPQGMAPIFSPTWAAIIWELAFIISPDFHRILRSVSFPRTLPPFYVITLKLDNYTLDPLLQHYAVIVLQDHIVRYFWFAGSLWTIS